MTVGVKKKTSVKKAKGVKKATKRVVKKTAKPTRLYFCKPLRKGSLYGPAVAVPQEDAEDAPARAVRAVQEVEFDETEPFDDDMTEDFDGHSADAPDELDEDDENTRR